MHLETQDLVSPTLFLLELWGKLTPRPYQDIERCERLDRFEDDSTGIRFLIGDQLRARSRVQGIAVPPQYLDIFVLAGKCKVSKLVTHHRAFACPFDSAAHF
jgi:quercetin 2,3-dioxygenase